MSRRVSTAAAIGIALPSLLAGTLFGILLRSHAEDAAAAPPRPAPRPAAAEPAPLRAAVPAPLDAAASPAPKAPTPPARPKNFQAAWSGLQEWFRGFDLKTRAGRERVPPDQLQRRAVDLQQALLNDPEGYLAALRSPENDDLSKFLLSLLCRVVGMEGGHMLLPVSQIPKPILDGLRELLASGTSNQKLGILQLAQMDRWFEKKGLIDDQALIDRCGALLSDADPMVRATAVEALQLRAPKREDRRFEVVQDLWRSSTDPALRAMCLQPLASMDTPAAREFLLKSLQEIGAGGVWTKDNMLMGTALQVVRTRMQILKPEEEDAYAGLCSSALQGVSDPMWYWGWMELSLHLPLARATALLGQAQSGAPTPEHQAAARRVLDLIRAGETRTDRLQAEVRKQN